MMLSLWWIPLGLLDLNISDLLSNPLVDKAFAVVMVFVLVKLLREDLGKLVAAVNEMTVAVTELTAETRNTQAHQTSRMAEIREGLRELIRLWTRDKKP